MSRSIHDNFVVSYTVQCEECILTLHTEYRDQGEPFERTEVRFEGVLGYLLRDGLGGILFDIEEDSIDRVLDEYATDFDWGAKYGWPWASAGSTDPREYVKSNGCKTFCIQGQNCFEGFIIAKTMTVEAAEQEPEPAG